MRGTAKPLTNQVEPAQHSHPRKSSPLSLAALIGGCFLGLLLCGAPLGLLAQKALSLGEAEAPRTEATPSPRQLPPSYTATPTPGITSTATAEQSFYDLYQLVSEDIDQALALMEAGEPAQAIPMWDHVVEVLPDYAPAYSQRARAYLELTENQRFLGEFESYVLQAIRDLDSAIELDPLTGPDYLQRSNAYHDLAAIQIYGAQADPLLEVALENLRIANQLGSGYDLSYRTVAFTLLDLGRCDEALEHASRLILARGPLAPPSAGLNTALALGYLCEGDAGRALEHLDLAIRLYPTDERRWSRAIVLYNLGRLPEARAEIDAWAAERPYYWGYRYYLRALINFEMGDVEAARADLDLGSGQTWEAYGLAAYVRGLLALHAGEMETAVEQLRLAEATTRRQYGPLLDRIRAELLNLGAQPLAPTALTQIDTTPIPTPGLISTQPPFGAVPMPTPTLPMNYAPMDEGSPWYQVDPGYSIYVSYEPPQPLQYSAVESLTLFLQSEPPDASADLSLRIWSPVDGSERYLYLEGGSYPVDFPHFYVSSQGQVIAAMVYPQGEHSIAARMGISLVVRLPDGELKTLGLGPDGWR